MAKHDGLAIIIGAKKPKSDYPKLSELLGKPSYMEDDSPDDDSPVLAMEDFINAIHAKDAKAALEAYQDLCDLSMDDDDSGFHDRGTASDAADDDES